MTTQPIAWVSEHGVLFKEFPPESVLKLTPLYTEEQIKKELEVAKQKEESK